MAETTETTNVPEPIVMIPSRHDDGLVEVLTAPPLSSISDELLVGLDPELFESLGGDVIRFGPQARYMIGERTADNGGHLLHRLP